MVRESNSLILGYTFKSCLPYPHQIRALQRALDLDKNTALFMEPGTGKTRVTIDFVGIKHLQYGLSRVVVCCPKVAMSVWEDQIKEFLPSMIKRKVLVLDESWGTVRDKIEVVKSLKKGDTLTFIIVNYDILADVTRTVKGKLTIYPGLKESLRKWKPEMVILDESHYIKSHTSSRSRAVHSLAQVPRWKMILSGTPITNSPMDLFSQFKFLDSDIFGSKWGPFKRRYGIYGGYGGFELIRYKNLDHLKKKASLISFEATKDEMDLPDKLPPQLIKIPISPKTEKTYDQMEKTMIAELKELGKKATASIILTKMIRLRQITGGFVRITNDDGSKEDIPVGREKLDALKELLSIHCKEGGYKVVVFAVFKWEVAQIKALCDSIKVKAIVDVGSRDDRIRFRDDKNTLVYIVPLSKGGIAVNELVAAHIGIFYSLDYSADHIIQAMDRLHRPGQSKNVLYQFLAIKGSIDVKLYKAFVEKKSIADEIIYDVRREIGR